jgi:hypothetical protein
LKKYSEFIFSDDAEVMKELKINRFKDFTKALVKNVPTKLYLEELSLAVNPKISVTTVTSEGRRKFLKGDKVAIKVKQEKGKGDRREFTSTHMS